MKLAIVSLFALLLAGCADASQGPSQEAQELNPNPASVELVAPDGNNMPLARTDPPSDVQKVLRVMSLDVDPNLIVGSLKDVDAALEPFLDLFDDEEKSGAAVFLVHAFAVSPPMFNILIRKLQSRHLSGMKIPLLRAAVDASSYEFLDKFIDGVQWTDDEELAALRKAAFALHFRRFFSTRAGQLCDKLTDIYNKAQKTAESGRKGSEESEEESEDDSEEESEEQALVVSKGPRALAPGQNTPSVAPYIFGMIVFILLILQNMANSMP